MNTDGSVSIPGVGVDSSAEIAARLRRFLSPQAKVRPGEKCEFCGETLPDEHSHVVNTENRGLMCSCRPCYLLFTNNGAAQGRYRVVPDRYAYVNDLVITTEQWDRLQIPVGIAFFFYNSEMDRYVAFYPSPAGATESLLPLEAWVDLASSSQIVNSIQPDVEALLARRERGGSIESYVVPIDICYELVGRMRKTWKGFDGGQEAREDIDRFFAAVRSRSGLSSEQEARAS